MLEGNICVLCLSVCLYVRRRFMQEDTTAFSTLGWFYFEWFEGDHQVGETFEVGKAPVRQKSLVDKRF